MSREIHEFSTTEAGSLLRSGQLTSVAMTEHALQRISKTDKHYHAFIVVLAARAREEARRADADFKSGIDHGPLHGIPYAVKDVIDVKDTPTSCASRTQSQHCTEEDADCVRRMSEAGAVLLGKLNTYEFATAGPSFDLPSPPAINPRAPDRITGGSSSGCAAAVAAGFVRVTIGTDGGGSARSPASYCGLVGLKPTYGTISCEGVFPLSPTLDHVGILAASVEDTSLCFDILSTVTTSEMKHEIAGLRVGYARHWSAGSADPDVQAALDNAAKQLQGLGASVEDVTLSPYEMFEACGTVIIQAEAYAVHAERLRKSPELFGAKAYQNLVSGCILDADDIAVAQATRKKLALELDQAIKPFDLLLVASTLTAALPVADFISIKPRWTDMRTFPFNVTGLPALAMPSGVNAEGLPLGLQLVGKRHSEKTLCYAASKLEYALALKLPPPTIL
jgi:aspartyl-tRNA(Asn)/glutamyl-tRNA(Gln) amidotransferase subunit A